MLNASTQTTGIMDKHDNMCFDKEALVNVWTEYIGEIYADDRAITCIHSMLLNDDGRHGTESKCVAQEDKGRPIATRRRHMAKVHEIGTSRV